MFPPCSVRAPPFNCLLTVRRLSCGLPGTRHALPGRLAGRPQLLFAQEHLRRCGPVLQGFRPCAPTLVAPNASRCRDIAFSLLRAAHILARATPSLAAPRRTRCTSGPHRGAPAASRRTKLAILQPRALTSFLRRAWAPWPVSPALWLRLHPLLRPAVPRVGLASLVYLPSLASSARPRNCQTCNGLRSTKYWFSPTFGRRATAPVSYPSPRAQTRSLYPESAHTNALTPKAPCTRRWKPEAGESPGEKRTY